MTNKKNTVKEAAFALVDLWNRNRDWDHDNIERLITDLRLALNRTRRPKVRHPDQPLVLTDDVLRFKQNTVVRYLYDCAAEGKTVNMNDLWVVGFPVADMEQFYQLIGYSVSGFGDISRFRKSTIARVDRLADEKLAQEKKG